MIDPVAFSIGPLGIRWYGIFIASAILLGMILVNKESKRQDINPDFFMDFFIYAIPLGVVGARLYYVIFNWHIYSRDPSRIIAVWQGGLAIHGGIIGGLCVLIYLVRKRGINFGKTVDILAPAVPLGEAIGRWGNFVNQEAYGEEVSKQFISWFPQFIQEQMYIIDHLGTFYRNPTFLYASLWNFLLFLFLLWLRRQDFVLKGDIFLSFLIGYSLGRFFIEGLRTDSLMLGPIRIAQLVSVLLIVGCGAFMYWRHRKEIKLHAK